jgi:hypothetical protein
MKRPATPRQELVDPVSQMLGDPGQNVVQPGLSVDLVQFGGDDLAAHGCAALGTGEQL